MSLSVETRAEVKDLGGSYLPKNHFKDTIIISQPSIPNLTSTEAHRPPFQRFELAPNLSIDQDIKEAGYDVLLEANRVYRDINVNLSQGKSLEDAVNISASELELNLRAYDLEIIQSRSGVPHANRFAYKDGIQRMVGNNGQAVVDAISAKERNGSALEGSKTIENFLIAAENNSFAVLMNPAGWNGFRDEYGREAEPHLNAEAMIFWKDPAGTLKGLTLVIDLDEVQARETMIGLGVRRELLETGGEHERLANIVRNPALLSLPEAYRNPFHYVLDKILSQRGSQAIRLKMRKGPPVVHSIDQVREDIDNFEQLLLLDLAEEAIVTAPKNYILAQVNKLEDKVFQQELIKKIEKALLLLAREQRRKELAVSSHELYVPPVVIDLDKEDFSKEKEFLKVKAGCPPSVLSSILGGYSLGIEGSANPLDRDGRGPLSFRCPHLDCRKVNKRVKNGQLKETCEHCRKLIPRC